MTPPPPDPLPHRHLLSAEGGVYRRGMLVVRCVNCEEEVEIPLDQPVPYSVEE